MAGTARDRAAARVSQARSGAADGAASQGAGGAGQVWTGRYMGDNRVYLRDGGESIDERSRTAGRAKRLVSQDQAILEFYEWSDERRAQWGQYLVGLGLIGEDEASDFSVLRDNWEALVGEAANFAAVGKQVSPHEAAKLVALGRPGPGAGGIPDGTRTSTSTQVDLTDPQTARALVNEVLASQLGREATPDEVAEFTRVLNAAERANPVSTSTTTQYEDGAAASQSSVTSGGLGAAGAQQLLVDQARATPNYAEYQAASTFMNLLMGAVQAPV